MKKNWSNANYTACWLLVLALVTVACREKNAGHEGHATEEKPATSGGPHAANMAGLDSTEILLKPTYEYVLSGTATIRPERKSIVDSLVIPGYLSYDARQVRAVSARYGGRIERLYVRYPFQPVKKGQHLLDIYSPAIATAQQDLIFLTQHDADNATLIESARRRLSLLGLTTRQIRDVETGRKPILSLPVFSPYAGLLVENPGLGPTGTSGGMSDNGATESSGSLPPSTTSAELSLREGMYVQAGQRLFGLQSLATVWAILEFYPASVQSLKIGQRVELRIESFAEPLWEQIDYIEPVYSAGSKNGRARVYLPNPGGRLLPGALLTATVLTGSRSALWIPATAALDLGKTNVVFVATPGGFRSRKISVGHRSGLMLEVITGLSPDDRIAKNAQLLIDSESFVKAN